MQTPNQEMIDRLVLGASHEIDVALARRAYRKAVSVLRAQDSVGRQGINWTSDDDPILRVKQKAISYESNAGSCKLLLTNFHRRVPVDKTDGTISVEVFPHQSDSNDFRYRNGEILFTFNRHGEIKSPLALVDAEVADSIIDLFLEGREELAA